jgi:hypothetical protein
MPEAGEELSETLEQPLPESKASIPMWSGEALSLKEAAAITMSADSSVIFLAGMPDSGKTTLLAALYEKFQNGPFAGWMFAGSRTLVRCEDICHYARLASGNATASTQRTRQGGEIELVHLSLSRQADRLRRELLLTDISGERFRQVRDSTEEAHRLQFAANASRVALFLDAGRLGSKPERQPAARDSRQILQSFIEAGVLTAETKLDLVISRADLASGPANGEEWKYIDSVVDDLCARFAPRLGAIAAWKVAARPAAGYDEAFGLVELFGAWVSPDLHRLAPIESLYEEQMARDDFGDALASPSNGPTYD